MFLFIRVRAEDVGDLGDGDICLWVDLVDDIFHFTNLKTVYYKINASHLGIMIKSSCFKQSHSAFESIRLGLADLIGV